jgi:hypothetical protein
LAPDPGPPCRTIGHFSSDEQQQVLVVIAHPAHMLPKLSDQPDPILPVSFPISIRSSLARNLD